jgi:regulation of enolase protein 1 (concanavalin A-like superfamily)
MAGTKTKTTIAVSIGIVLALGIAILFFKIWRPSDLSALQGTWIGRQVGGGPAHTSTLVIHDSTIELRGANPSDLLKGTFSLHPGYPKQIVIVIVESPMSEYVGKTVNAIYLFKNGTLTIAGNEPGNPAFPRSFNEANANTFIFRKEGATLVSAEDPNPSLASPPPEPESTGFFSGWGNVINPDKDCTVTLKNGTLSVAVPGTDHALMPERNKINAPRVMQEVSGFFDLQTKVSGDFHRDLKSAVAGRWAYQDAGLLLWKDDENNLKLSYAHTMGNGQPFAFFNLEFRQNGQRGQLRFPKEANAALGANPIYLRLQLHADQTTASVSADGKDWVTITLPADDQPEKLHAGIIVGNNTTTPLTAIFEEFSLVPQ